MTPRLHYRHLTLSHIDAQIRQLRERRADISIEIQRIDNPQRHDLAAAIRQIDELLEIPELTKIEKRCVELANV